MQKNKWVAGMCLGSMVIFVLASSGYASDGIATASTGPVESAVAPQDMAPPALPSEMVAAVAAMAFVIPPPPLPDGPLPPIDSDGRDAPPVPNDSNGNPVLADPDAVPAGPADEDVGDPPPPPPAEEINPDDVPIDPEFADEEDCMGEDPALDENGNIIPVPDPMFPIGSDPPLLVDIDEEGQSTEVS